jgi:hypothetical protein
MADLGRDGGGPPSRSDFLRRGAAVFGGIIAQIPLLAGCAAEGPEERAGDALDALRKTDPALVKHRETGRVETGMREPRGIAFGPDGSLWIVGDRSIARQGAGGVRPVAGLDDAPQCLGIGPDGLLYVGMSDHVEVYDASGRRQAGWGTPGARSLLTAIAVGPADVWVADSGSRLVHRYDRSGRRLGSIGERDEAAGYQGLIVPSPHLDVAVLSSGLVCVSNPGMHRLEMHAPQGGMEASWGEPRSEIDAFCGCCNPTDFAMLAGGRFVTSEKGIPRVKIYSARGVFESVVAGPEAFASNLMGMDLAVGAHDQVAVLDAHEKAVRLFDPVREGRHAG